MGVCKGVRVMSETKYTQKSLEAIQGAQNLATEFGNQQLEQAHLLSALMQEENGLIPQLLKKMGKDAAQVKAQAEALVNKCPRVSGAAREQGKIYISQDLDRAITAAAKIAQRMKDEYISVEHLFLALLENPDRDLQKLFQNHDIRKETEVFIIVKPPADDKIVIDRESDIVRHNLADQMRIAAGRLI